MLSAVASAVIVLVAAGWPPLLSTDKEVANWFHARALTHPAWTEANRVLTDWVWDPVTMRLVIGAAALWVWLRGEGVLALWCLATTAVGAGVQQGLKALVDRPRPEWQQPVDSAHFAAMPSGHAMTAALTCVVVVWLVQRSAADRALRALVLLLACVSVAGACLTRVALGVHWLTDTVVGAVLGIALAALSIGLWCALVNRGSLGASRSPV
ncbi:undecaprenyl-diphosphatase [Streptomyces sp. WMMB 322]|nr:undecaprenyl-diphosphatase [Streptomyces sp. WMMB 322]